MSKKLHILLIFLLVNYCTSNTELNSQDSGSYQPPLIKFVCNETINENSVTLDVYVLINAKNSKLYNGSIKGTGVASNFYRNINDVQENTIFEGNYIFEITKNGSYSAIFFIEDPSDSFIHDCSGQVATTTSTTRPTTTTSTTRPTTTTSTTRPTTTTSTTRPTTTTSTIPNIINISFEQTMKGCSNNKTTSNLLVNNLTSNVEATFVLEKSTVFNNTFSTVYEGLITKSGQLNFTQELKMQDWVIWRWKIFNGSEWSEFKYSDNFTGCWDLTGIEYDTNLYIKRWFTGINDNPFICEIPGTGTQQGYDWGRCISSEQWREYPNMEKADGNWVRFCAKDGWYESC